MFSEKKFSKLTIKVNKWVSKTLNWLSDIKNLLGFWNIQFLDMCLKILYHSNYVEIGTRKRVSIEDQSCNSPYPPKYSVAYCTNEILLNDKMPSNNYQRLSKLLVDFRVFFLVPKVVASGLQLSAWQNCWSKKTVIPRRPTFVESVLTPSTKTQSDLSSCKSLKRLSHRSEERNRWWQFLKILKLRILHGRRGNLLPIVIISIYVRCFQGKIFVRA